MDPDLQAIIQQQTVIEISTFDDRLLYSGACLRADEELWIIVNFEEEKGCFDGYTVFRNDDVDAYFVDEEEPVAVPQNNLQEYADLRRFGSFSTFEDFFRSVSATHLVAIFDEVAVDSYYVGKVLSAGPEDFEVQLYTEEGEKGSLVRMAFSELKYFSFDTKYDRALAEKGMLNA